MQKVLVIEDDLNKANQIIDYLNVILSNPIITSKQSYQSGLSMILNNEFELVVLDMSIPIFDVKPEESKSAPEPYTGKDILRKMYRKKRKFPVIVVSQFEILGDSTNKMSLHVISNELKESYDNYYGHVHYDAASEDWKKNLSDIIQYIKENNYDRDINN